MGERCKANDTISAADIQWDISKIDGAYPGLKEGWELICKCVGNMQLQNPLEPVQAAHIWHLEMEHVWPQHSLAALGLGRWKRKQAE